MLRDEDYQRIESEIASDASPVGIDAKKTHVMILAKLESIEQRLDRLEQRPAAAGGIPAGVRGTAENGVAALTDTLDEAVDRLGQAGIDVDTRGRHALALLERVTHPSVLDALSRIIQRVEALEPLSELATHGPHAAAALADTFDEEVSRLAESGVEVDAALRNGLAAVLYLGQRISTKELEALGTLLRSDVLHPSAVDVVGRLGCALVAAAEAPLGSVGPIGAVSKLGNQDTRRSTAFLLEFAKQFGAALNSDGRACTDQINGGARDV
jgi:hypothetical protein